jgi:hypothetical protein
MNKQMFRDYIDCFNRNDFAGFSRYYAEDVVLELPKGDSIRIVSFVHYKIRDGRFAHIKSARFRTLSP